MTYARRIKYGNQLIKDNIFRNQRRMNGRREYFKGQHIRHALVQHGWCKIARKINPSLKISKNICMISNFNILNTAVHKPACANEILTWRIRGTMRSGRTDNRSNSTAQTTNAFFEQNSTPDMYCITSCDLKLFPPTRRTTRVAYTD